MIQKPDHGRNRPKVGNQTAITEKVRREIDRRSRERFNSNVAMCERCGTTRNLTAAHIQAASQLGSGSDPANIILLCGTHGWKGTCHDYVDNTAKGRDWLKRMGERLAGYYEKRREMAERGIKDERIYY